MQSRDAVQGCGRRDVVVGRRSCRLDDWNEEKMNNDLDASSKRLDPSSLYI
jgi:hypothetical protein